MNAKKMAATASPEVARLAVPTVENERALVEQEIARTQEYFDQPRFDEITRLYSTRQVVAQRGTINKDYTVARDAAIETVEADPGLRNEPRLMRAVEAHWGERLALIQVG